MKDQGLSLKKKPSSRRAWFGKFWTGIASACMIITLIPLFAVLIFVLLQGFQRLNFNLFTQLPPPQDSRKGGLLMPLLEHY